MANPKKKVLVEMWGASQSEANVWCDNPGKLFKIIKAMPGISKVETRSPTSLYIMIDARYDYREIIQEIEALGQEPG